jgi:hypothetical protein
MRSMAGQRYSRSMTSVVEWRGANRQNDHHAGERQHVQPGEWTTVVAAHVVHAAPVALAIAASTIIRSPMSL